jgi:transposase
VADSATDTRRAPIIRRRFTAEFKREVVAEATQPGASLALVARRHDLNANQVQKWRRLMERSESASFVPVAIVPAVAAERPHGGGVEFELSGGHRIRVHEPVDPVVLKVIVTALMR